MIEISLLLLQAFQVLFLWIHDSIPLGRLNDVAAVSREDTRARLVVVTLIQSVPFTIGLLYSALYFRRSYPHWLNNWLWISYGVLFVGQLRAWWIPYLFRAEPERATRYRMMFGNTHSFLPHRNGIVPNTAHILLHLSTEDLALAAANHWNLMTTALFADAPYHSAGGPLERLLAYVDFRKALLRGELPEFTCFVGTMVQEVYGTHPALRAACEQSISKHAATLEADIAEAMRQHDVHGEWTPRSLALYTQAVIQGAFILAKAKDGHEVAAECLDYLHRFIEMLFTQTGTKEKHHDRNLSKGNTRN